MGDSNGANRGVAGQASRLTEDAADELAALDHECNRPPWNEAMFLGEFTSPHSRLWGWREDKRLAAFLAAHVVRDEAHIVNYGVASYYRRRGIGRALLEQVLHELYRDGVLWCTLEVRRSNEIAQRLYGSLGFSEAAICERYYTDDLEDAVVMNLHLKDFIARHPQPWYSRAKEDAHVL